MAHPLAVRADGPLFKANTWTGRVRQAFGRARSAGRTTLWDLAVGHASARADEVAVSRRHGDRVAAGDLVAALG
ncbi:hypothetical protein ACWEIM_21145 [Streptomyces sp. NPDC004778]